MARESQVGTLIVPFLVIPRSSNYIVQTENLFNTVHTSRSVFAKFGFTFGSKPMQHVLKSTNEEGLGFLWERGSEALLSHYL